MMNLLSLRDYLAQVGNASLLEISTAFSADPVYTKMMLNHWVNKGLVRIEQQKFVCNKPCAKCPPQSVLRYIWSQKA